MAQEINQPEFQYEKDKMRDKIEAAFYALSSKYQEILRLHYEEKVPVKQIALRFDLSFKATESRLFRARQQFKAAYERA
jgi:RNA polymerase sigma factor (sigma-70 family)